MASTALDSTTESLSKLGIHPDFAASAPNLQKNLRLLSAEQVRIRVCVYIRIVLLSVILVNWLVLIGNGGDVAD
jgi:hypothetical protein